MSLRTPPWCPGAPFWFRFASEGRDCALVDDADLDRVGPQRSESMGARSSPFGHGVVEVHDPVGRVVSRAETSDTNHVWAGGLAPNSEYTYRVTVDGDPLERTVEESRFYNDPEHVGFVEEAVPDRQGDAGQGLGGASPSNGVVRPIDVRSPKGDHVPVPSSSGTVADTAAESTAARGIGRTRSAETSEPSVLRSWGTPVATCRVRPGERWPAPPKEIS